ncbi:MAG: hypothetical protein H6597_07880 [Flavobacteriales bacterium]|nr:hypothetical protein [Flavobacteriales bacterium]MCB9194436.1 hypothetical protein [Flavobacteriales bacterium]
MRGKRYRSRRQWYNTQAWAYFSVGLFLAGTVGALTTGRFLYPILAFTVIALGLGVAYMRDRGEECTYIIDEQHVVLRNAREEVSIPHQSVVDTSLIDRSAARDYIIQHAREDVPAGAPRSVIRRREGAFVRYCSVDIGLRTFTFGLGRRMIDRMPNSKNDLVLLRLRNGEEYLLSPLYNQDLVSTLSRIAREPGPVRVEG